MNSLHSRALCLGDTIEPLRGWRQLGGATVWLRQGWTGTRFSCLPAQGSGLTQTSLCSPTLLPHYCLGPGSYFLAGPEQRFYVLSSSLTRGLSGLGFSFPPTTSTDTSNSKYQSSELNQWPCKNKRTRRCNEAFIACVRFLMTTQLEYKKKIKALESRI